MVSKKGMWMTELYLKDPNRQLDDFFLNKIIELEQKLEKQKLQIIDLQLYVKTLQEKVSENVWWIQNEAIRWI